MSKSITITLSDGRHAIIAGDIDPITNVQSLSFQLSDAAGQILTGPTLLEQSHGPDGRFIQGALIDTQSFAAVALDNGGFEVVFNAQEADAHGFDYQVLIGVGVDAHGQVIRGAGSEADGQLTGNVRFNLDGGARTAVFTPVDVHLQALDGGRFAVSHPFFSAGHDATTSVSLATLGGAYATALAGAPNDPVNRAPDLITHSNGDIGLLWNQNGTIYREVLGEDGSILSPKAVTNAFFVNTNGSSTFTGFDAAHDQIEVFNPDGSKAGGTHSTLTVDMRDHTLTWDQDSEGPIAPAHLGTLNADHFGVANLADGFRPEVLKVIAADGSETIQWYDSDNSQPWDTLLAAKDAHGDVVTYGSTLDDGSRQTFHFDTDNSQPWQRYVDQQDAAGHVLQRTVLVDNGQSWSATFTYGGGQIVSYEVDSFDVNGQLVGKGFFHADGTPL